MRRSQDVHKCVRNAIGALNDDPVFLSSMEGGSRVRTCKCDGVEVVA